MEKEIQKIEKVNNYYLKKIESWKNQYKPLKYSIFKDRYGKVDYTCLNELDTSSSYVAVDSAFKREQYLHADLYYVSAVAVSDRYLDDSMGCIEIETTGMAEEDEERAVRLLEGLAFSNEILLASEKERSYRYIFLDGSLHTFLIKLNSAFTLAFKGSSPSRLRRKLQELYKDVTKSFSYMLEYTPLVAIPKAFRSKGDEASRFIEEKMGEKVNTYLFLDSILDNGEYVWFEGFKKSLNI
ncbi:MAG TPA: hypothetical protein DEA47_01020 [Peptococcaceae bacterium]|nr:MAG: hypothetical protein XD50_0283 [Clostridia bacterium 41_269]HBT19946.1 hypothetical protein [Peptococcaceae bacterium]